MAATAPCPLDLCDLPGAVVGGVTSRAGSVVSNAVASAAGDWIQSLADAVQEALGKALGSLGTLWVNVGTPNLTTSGGHPSDAVSFVQGSLWWFMGAAAIVAVVVGGARMAWEQRAEPGRDVLRGLLTLVVVIGAGLTVITLAVAAADGFSSWVIDDSLEGTDFGQNVAAMIGIASRAGPLGPLLVIIFGFVAIVVSSIQIMLMVVRGGMLVILAGILPLAASFTSTEMGRTWFRKSCAWTIAFILYKPVAALVYATAFRLVGTDVLADDDESGLLNVLVGLVLMILALVALPALMRFVTPMVAATAGGGGRSALGSAALASLPSGAIAIGNARARMPSHVPRQGGSGGGGFGGGGFGGGGGPSGSAAGGAARAGSTAAAAAGPAGAVAGQELQAGRKGAAAARGAVANSDGNDNEEGPDGSRR